MSDKRPKFGVAVPNFVPPGIDLNFGSIVQYVKRAEELGFDSAWSWEHIFLGSRSPFHIYDCMTLLPALAALTNRINLGISVIALPTRNPVILAKNLATLDCISNGRLMLGVSAGWYEKEFTALGYSFKDRGKSIEANLEIIKRMWTENDINGDYGQYHLAHISIEPKPVQKPHPPILMGGYVPSVLRRAGKQADGWLSYFYPPAEFRKSWEEVLNSARASDRSEASMHSANIVLGYVTSDIERGKSLAKDFATRYFDLPPWSKASLDSAIIGSTSQCGEKMNEYLDAGVQNLILIPVGYEMNQMELFARDVIRHL